MNKFTKHNLLRKGKMRNIISQSYYSMKGYCSQILIIFIQLKIEKTISLSTNATLFYYISAIVTGNQLIL